MAKLFSWIFPTVKSDQKVDQRLRKKTKVVLYLSKKIDVEKRKLSLPFLFFARTTSLQKEKEAAAARAGKAQRRTFLLHQQQWFYFWLISNVSYHLSNVIPTVMDSKKNTYALCVLDTKKSFVRIVTLVNSYFTILDDLSICLFYMPKFDDVIIFQIFSRCIIKLSKIQLKLGTYRRHPKSHRRYSNWKQDNKCKVSVLNDPKAFV